MPRDPDCVVHDEHLCADDALGQVPQCRRGSLARAQMHLRNAIKWPPLMRICFAAKILGR